MKCGTTSLFNHLADHPEVAPCRTKEPNYFSGDAFNADDPNAYFALWDWDPSRHKIAIEASNAYAKMHSRSKGTLQPCTRGLKDRRGRTRGPKDRHGRTE
jgi:hypothetical protein